MHHYKLSVNYDGVWNLKNRVVTHDKVGSLNGQGSILWMLYYGNEVLSIMKVRELQIWNIKVSFYVMICVSILTQFHDYYNSWH